MKNLIMTCLALAVCANMSGQKLDAMSRVALQQMKEETSASANASYAKSLGISAANTTNNINAVVKLQEGADLSELTAHGFDASDLCSGFAIVHTTMNDLAALAELESVERISIAQRKMELMLNHANAMTALTSSMTASASPVPLPTTVSATASPLIIRYILARES